MRLCLPMQKVLLVGSHLPHGQKTKTKTRNNIVTNSIKTLKIVNIKKSLKRKTLL